PHARAEDETRGGATGDHNEPPPPTPDIHAEPEAGDETAAVAAAHGGSDRTAQDKPLEGKARGEEIRADGKTPTTRGDERPAQQPAASNPRPRRGTAAPIAARRPAQQ